MENEKYQLFNSLQELQKLIKQEASLMKLCKIIIQIYNYLNI